MTDKSSCNTSHVGQAGQGGAEQDIKADDRMPTGQAGTGQSTDKPNDPGAPRDYDSDPQGGGGKLDQVNNDDAPAAGGDAPSHGSR